MIFGWLLLFVPLSALLAYVVHAPPLWVFLTALGGLVPLAEYVRKATDQLAKLAGPAIGGLLNVSFGNVPEIVLALFLLARGEGEVVKAQLTGAIIGNSLLGLGLAIIAGSWGVEKRLLRRERSGLLGSLLVIVVIALLLPALFDLSQHSLMSRSSLLNLEQSLSYSVAVVLILVYAGNLVYTLVTHRDIFSPSASPEAAEWTCGKALAVLGLATAGTALEAELISGGLETAAMRTGLSTVFIGIIVLAVAGNASEYFSAIYFATKGKMGMAFTITMGSSIQIALLVAPILVLLSSLTGHPLNLVFSNPLEMIAIAGSAFAVNAISQDGETTWFEGVMLLAVYMLFALAFFHSTH